MWKGDIAGLPALLSNQDSSAALALGLMASNCISMHTDRSACSQAGQGSKEAGSALGAMAGGEVRAVEAKCAMPWAAQEVQAVGSNMLHNCPATQFP
jgi:hypothetical protein